jgi:hypothetical protein
VSPFFIIGSGRSGSTLLRLMLLGHSRIEIPSETWFIRPLVRSLPLDCALTESQVTQAVQIITSHYRWPDMGMGAEALQTKASDLICPRLVDVINLVYQHHLSSSGKLRIADKTPPYVEIVPELAVLYPDARFIHLVRDGRDVAISYIELGLLRGFRYYERDFDWSWSLRFREKLRGTKLEERILDVRYEDLVSEPERIIRSICQFVGEPFEPGMLQWNDRRHRVPPRERKFHPKLDKTLSPDSIGIWRKKLSPLERFAMEASLRKYLKRWGYPLSYSSKIAESSLVFAGSILHAASPVLIKVIPYLRRRKLWPANSYI